MVATATAGGGGGLMRRVWCYVAPTVAFAALFNMPKFFELRSEWVEVNATTEGQTLSLVRMKPTEMRLNEHYVYFYVNLARFVVMCVGPFLGLVFLNSGIRR